MAEIKTNIHEFKASVHDCREDENVNQLILEAIQDILKNEPTNLQYANQVLNSLPKRSAPTSH